MPVLRPLRLLAAVEAGTTNSAQLQTFLTDAGRAAEFGVLLASRGQSRRMAGNTLTMAAIVSAPAATSIVFTQATTATNAACTAVVASSVAMSAVANSSASLNTVAANPVAWDLFKVSTYYEVNVRTIIALLAGLNPVTYPTISSLITQSVPMGAIASADYAMSSVVASSATTTVMAGNSIAMALVAGDTSAIDIVAAAPAATMTIIANSTVAMSEIVSRPIATTAMATYPVAIQAISKSTAGWASYLAGPNFAANLPLALANLIGVAPASYPTLDSIIADAVALGKVAASTPAVQALASNSAAMTTLANSANVGIILGSATAMAVIGSNNTAMTTFITNANSRPSVFASPTAKGFIVASTALVDVISGNAATVTYLNTIKATATATGIPDGVVGAYQAFTGVPAKVLVLSAKEVGIAATFSNYKFGGSSMAGTNAGAQVALSASVTLTHIAGYTGITWDLQGIGVTAATLPIINYVDMT